MANKNRHLQERSSDPLNRITKHRRPRSVLAAQSEIMELGMYATFVARIGGYIPHQARAVAKCLMTASKLRSLAPAAAAYAADRVAESPSYGDAWQRQWARDEPPIGDDNHDEMMSEGPLWYLALTVRQLRRALERGSDGQWMATADELKAIASSQSFATLALGAVSMEAIVAANRSRRETRAKAVPVTGPKLQPAKLAKVVPISA